MNFLNKKAKGLEQGAIRAMFDKAIGMSDVISMGIGEPDMPTPSRRYGYIVPMQDAQALSEGMLKALRQPMPKEMLQERAEAFSEKQAVDAYLNLLGMIGVARDA